MNYFISLICGVNEEHVLCGNNVRFDLSRLKCADVCVQRRMRDTLDRLCKTSAVTQQFATQNIGGSDIFITCVVVGRIREYSFRLCGLSRIAKKHVISHMIYLCVGLDI